MNCLRINLEDMGRMGRWETFEDTMNKCYTVLPKSDTLTKIAGCATDSDYKPYHCMLQPPEQLFKQVLSQFHQAKKDCKQVRFSHHLFHTLLLRDVRDLAI